MWGMLGLCHSLRWRCAFDKFETSAKPSPQACFQPACRLQLAACEANYTWIYRWVVCSQMGLSENVVYPYTQWFCWSDFPMKNLAISLGVYPTYPIFRHTQITSTIAILIILICGFHVHFNTPVLPGQITTLRPVCPPRHAAGCRTWSPRCHGTWRLTSLELVPSCFEGQLKV